MTIQTVKVGDIAEQVRGVTYSKSDASADESEGMVPILRANNITDQGLQFSNLVWVPKSCVSSKQMLRKGDIVVATSSGSLDVVGKAAPVEHDVGASFGAFCKVVRPGKTADSHYLANYFKTAKYRSTISSLAAGANINNLRNEHINSLEIPLPPLAEQKRIAAILDKADAIRRKLQQSLRLSDDFLRSVFLEMFGSDKSPKCERVPLGPFLEFMTSGGRGWSQYYAPSGARFIRSLDVQMNEIGEKDVAYVAVPNNAEAKRTRVQENDVLLTITGSLIGRVARIPKEHAGAYISQHVAILRLGKGLDPEFLARFLSMDEGQRLVQKSQYGQTKPGLNFDQIRRFTVPLTSATLQKRFVEIANRVNASSMKSRAFMSQSETLFSSLQQRAFRSEL